MAYRVIGVRIFPDIEEPASSSTIQDFFCPLLPYIYYDTEESLWLHRERKVLKKDFEWKHAFWVPLKNYASKASAKPTKPILFNFSNPVF